MKHGRPPLPPVCPRGFEEHVARASLWLSARGLQFVVPRKGKPFVRKKP